MEIKDVIQSIDNVLNSDYRYDETIGYQLTSDDFEWLRTAKSVLEDRWIKDKTGWIKIRVTNWISIKERLPNPDDVVLAVCYGRNIRGVTFDGAIEFAYCDQYDSMNRKCTPKWYLDEYQDEDGQDIRVVVTHWMPVPDPPQEVIDKWGDLMKK